MTNLQKLAATFLVILTFSMMGCGGSGTSSIQADPYKPTIINAGIDQEANEQTHLSLQGSVIEGSVEVSSMQWIQTSGISIDISNKNSLISNIILPTTDRVTELSFDFIVNDVENSQIVDSVTIKVLPVNIDAGVDLIAKEQSLVKLSSVVGGQHENILSYHWEQTSGPYVELIDSDSPNPSFIAPGILKNQVIVLQVSIKDDEDVAEKDSVNITIIPIPEVVITFPGNGLYTQKTIDVAGRVEEYTGDYAAITVTVASNGNQRIIFVDQEGNWRANDFPLLDVDGQHVITVLAEDGASFSSSDQVVLNIGSDIEKLTEEVLINDKLGTIYHFSFNKDDEKLYVNSSINQNQENLKITIIDPTNSIQRNTSSPSQGDTVFDSALDRLLIVKPTYGGALITFDINNQQSENLLISPLKADKSFPNPRGICLFENSALAFIALDSEVLKVDLNTGVTTTLSDAVIGVGDPLEKLDSITCNESENIVIVLDSAVRNGGFNSIYNINATNGNRSLRDVFISNIPSINPDTIVFDKSTNSLLMTSQGSYRSVYRLNDMNQRILISNQFRGRGPSLGYSPSIALDEKNARVFIEGPSNKIFLVDIESGDRVAIAW
ncbi:MAG: hypothetical protein JKY50_09075 [Oleispira sp.]|nr:hypothetical protein [Oleispira sp.]MBL4880934.1 hypothetical protein [Oleispira sp.]